MTDASGPDRASESPHELRNPPELAPAAGFSHVVVPADGRTVFLAGQTAHGPEGAVQGDGFVEQFRHACRNVRTALEAAGGRPGDLVWLQLFTTDMDAYLAEQQAVGAAYREVLGRHFPAMSMFEVSRLVDPDAVIEIVALAVVPDR